MLSQGCEGNVLFAMFPRFWNDRRRCARNQEFVLHHHELQNALHTGLREDGGDCAANSPLFPCSEKPSEDDLLLFGHIPHLCGHARRQSQGENKCVEGLTKGTWSVSATPLQRTSRPARIEQRHKMHIEAKNRARISVAIKNKRVL